MLHGQEAELCVKESLPCASQLENVEEEEPQQKGEGETNDNLDAKKGEDEKRSNLDA